MNSSDLVADRAGARQRSVARRRGRVSARIALFRDAFSGAHSSSSAPGNTPFVGEGYFPVVSPAYSNLRRRQRMRKRKMRKWISTGYPYSTASATRSLFSTEYTEFLKATHRKRSYHGAPEYRCQFCGAVFWYQERCKHESNIGK